MSRVPAGCQILDTAPASHCYSGGLLCNLADPSSPLRPDYLCGEFTWDAGTRHLNWYHHDAAGWTRRRLATDVGIAVGMAAADLTGSGTADLVAAEWRLGPGRDDEASRLFWFENPGDPDAPWPRHVLARDWDKTHDVLIGDVTGAGGHDVVARMKDGRIAWLAAPEDPRQPWDETVICPAQPGDGTALWDVTGSGGVDVVTAAGVHENVDGDGRRWTYRPIAQLEPLGVDVETRVVAADVLGDGSVCLAIAESEVLRHARLWLLHSADRGRSWRVQTLVDGERDLGALHTLQWVHGTHGADLFVAEMELYRKDADFTRAPTWRLFRHRGDLRFDEDVVLDAGLGAHQGAAGPVTDPGTVDFVAKNWMAHPDNACGGDNHVVHVRGGVAVAP